MEKGKHIFWESILIVASVLVFRSLWLLIDQVPFLSQPNVLVISFVIGMVFAGIAYYRLVHAD